MKILIRVDGSCIPNPGNMAIGVVIYRDGELWKKISELIGKGTNNIAEYSAVIRGLEEIRDIPVDSVQLYCDSQLIVKQLNGQFKVKDKKMIPLYERIQELIKEINAPVFFIWNRREDNQLADQLARKLLIKEEQNKRALASQDLVIEEEGDYFLVQSKQKKKIYRVNLEIPECDCYDFINNCRKWNLECKHIVAARKFAQGRVKEKSVQDDKKMRVLIFSKMVKTEKWIELLERYNQDEHLPLEFIFPHEDSEKLSSQLASTEVIVGGELRESELSQAKKLKLFQLPFAGVDRQDLEIFKKYPQIFVCNTHGNSHAVSEQAFCLLLALAKNLINYDRDLRKGKWHGFVTGEPAIQIKGKNLGIIGLGAIGLEIARRALSFGMKVYAIKHTIKKEEELEQKYGLAFLGTPDQLEYVVTQSDFIIIALPLTAKTENIIDDRILGLMKGKYLINIGRGKVIDEKALYLHLKNGTLSGAAIDTWYQYPARDLPVMLPSKYPFQELNNVIMSPHTAGYTDKSIEENILAVYKNIKKVFYGQEPGNRINLEEGY